MNSSGEKYPWLSPDGYQPGFLKKMAILQNHARLWPSLKISQDKCLLKYLQDAFSSCKIFARRHIIFHDLGRKSSDMTFCRARLCKDKRSEVTGEARHYIET